MVAVPDHYLIHYQNINHKHKDDIHQEYDKQDEISSLLNVHVLHEIHNILMLVQDVEYTNKQRIYIFHINQRDLFT
jgi:hypothetical protein